MKLGLERKITILYLLIYLIAALSIALHQPLYDTPPEFGNPPDEHSRYMVPLYICNHGTLPNGFEEELFSGGCKWTYGFYTLLPYMVQGYAMRFVNLFTDSPLALLYTARLVNVFIGFLMAIVVLKIGKKLFRNDNVRWLFCFLVTFLPQSLFLHTYVNPDSMCLLSTALMIYGILCGYEDGFSLKSSAVMTLGIILCALSYYNAYGFIVSMVLLFTAYFFKKEEGKLSFAWSPFLKKGCLIAGVVLLCISWSFIRNYLLYDGDYIGLETKENFIKSFGIARETFESRGESLLTMLTSTSFLPKVIISFIANYGSGTIYAFLPIYGFFLLLFLLGFAGLFFPGGDAVFLSDIPKGKRVFFHANMLFCIVMPFILLIKYAYSVDYQAQGRYIMPGVILIMGYLCHGLEKLPFLRKLDDRKRKVVFALLSASVVAALFIMIFANAMPVYNKTGVLG
ncbi:MAG: DUF2142 domain-containing protein [Lachnospiraceae bacterium]